MIAFIQLQAAMGLGILLMEFGILLLFVVLPVLTVFNAVRSLSKLRRTGARPELKDYLVCFLRGFVYALAMVLGIAVFTCLLIYFCVDLSLS